MKRNDEARMTNTKKTTKGEARNQCVPNEFAFGFRASDFIRHSSFVIRHSRWLAIVFLLLATFLSSGCGRHITDANLAHVKSDMCTKEVESILGPPTRTESPPELKSQEVKTLSVTRYIYEQKGRVVELTFVGDKLAGGGVKGNFGK
jgi:hypothetical protein